eukprot:UN12597
MWRVTHAFLLHFQFCVSKKYQNVWLYLSKFCLTLILQASRVHLGKTSRREVVLNLSQRDPKYEESVGNKYEFFFESVCGKEFP